MLAEVGETYSPKGATAIVVDPRSSQVLAMANWPPVDPDDLDEASNEDLLNRATGFTYEPGSTFKAFTVAAALEEKPVTPTSEFILPPMLQVADRTIEDAHPRGTETMSVATILAHSSNVGAVTIGLELGAEKFNRWIHRFGFGRPTGVQYPAEEQGLVLDLDEYSGSTMGNLPIGQGLSVTPMQMVAGYAAIANGGMLRPPQLIKQIGEEPVDEPKGKRVISPQVASEVREMLEGVLAPGGTASEVSVPGYTLAGKTGTAEVAENGDLLGDQIRRLLHRLRAGPEPAAAGGGDRRPAAGGNLRRVGGGAGLRPDRGVRAALPRCPAGIGSRVPSPRDRRAAESGCVVRGVAMEPLGEGTRLPT